MNRKKNFALITLVILSLCIAISTKLIQPSAPNKSVNAQLTISAATSLKEALTDITKLYSQSNTKIVIRNNFGSSGALQQQIENGAPVDIFFAAATKQMDELQNKKLILPETRRNLLANQLVLIVPNTNNVNENIDNNINEIFTVESLTNLNIQRIAIGDPRSVPVGQYAEQALKKIGIWQQIQTKFVLGNNVRQVLQFVESGNAQAGIVYATDAKTSKKIKIVQRIDAGLHEPILYPIAVLQKSAYQATAKDYLQFLVDEPAKLIFEKYGFNTL